MELEYTYWQEVGGWFIGYFESLGVQFPVL
jgi:hypothetical protein